MEYCTSHFIIALLKIEQLMINCIKKCCIVFLSFPVSLRGYSGYCLPDSSVWCSLLRGPCACRSGSLPPAAACRCSSCGCVPASALSGLLLYRFITEHDHEINQRQIQCKTQVQYKTRLLYRSTTYSEMLFKRVGTKQCGEFFTHHFGFRYLDTSEHTCLSVCLKWSARISAC